LFTSVSNDQNCLHSIIYPRHVSICLANLFKCRRTRKRKGRRGRTTFYFSFLWSP